MCFITLEKHEVNNYIHSIHDSGWKLKENIYMRILFSFRVSPVRGVQVIPVLPELSGYTYFEEEGRNVP